MDFAFEKSRRSTWSIILVAATFLISLESGSDKAIFGKPQQDPPQWLVEEKARVDRQLSPGTDIWRENKWLVQERARIDREVVQPCKSSVKDRAVAGEDRIRGCQSCSGLKKQQNIQELHEVRDQELARCQAKGIDVENAYVNRMKRDFIDLLNDPTAQWKLINAPVTSTYDRRNASRYAEVINEFKVEESPRYAARRGDTYCNYFALDVTRNMDAELAPELQSRKANEISEWLEREGAAHGWRQVDWIAGQEMANQGRPTIALWENPNPSKHGHIAVVRPGSSGDPRGVAIAQAGSEDFTVNAMHLKDAFVGKGGPLRPIQYWFHN